MAAGAIIAAVGIGVSMYAQYSEGQAKAQAAQADAANKQAMANETLDRAAANRQSLELQAGEQVGNQKSQFAAGNVDVSSGSPLMVMENTYASSRRKIYMDQENANWEAQQDLISGANETTLAGQEQQAGNIGAAGSLLTGAGSMAARSSQSTPAGGGNSPTVGSVRGGGNVTYPNGAPN